MSNVELEKILFLDIETVPLVYRYEDLDETSRQLWNKKWQHNKDLSPRDHYAKAGIYAEFARVVCVGLGYYQQNSFEVMTIAADNEKAILKDLADFLKSRFNTEAHFLCAHNGKEFDFPFLCRRYLINDIGLPKLLQIQGKKPWEVRHLDTMDMWKFGDYKNYSSINLLAHVFGLPSPKEDMDGSMVSSTYYEQGDLRRIEEYCKKDVITLARVYCRFAGTPVLGDDKIIFA